MLAIAFGTRPEWIKLKPLLAQLEGKIPFKLIFTGQHTTLVDIKEVSKYDVQIFNIDNVCKSRLDSILASTLINLDLSADMVVVHGDTTSALAVALSAFHKGIRIAHIEAGLRSESYVDPYPEEFNRRSISAMSYAHFCPTRRAMLNLVAEGFDRDRIYVVGNTCIDNLLDITPSDSNEVLITMHRRENHHNMDEWFKNIEQLSFFYNFSFVFPMHPNENVTKHKHIFKGIKVVDPIPYDQFIQKVASCKAIITDSGGIQEEASYFKKPVVVCRRTTERPEGLNNFSWLCKDPYHLYNVFDTAINIPITGDSPYGDGHASERIATVLGEIL